MADIRIITGRAVAPDLDMTMKLAGCGDKVADKEKALFASLERIVRQCIRPKCALAFADEDGKPCLYAVLTLGAAISRQIDLCQRQGEYDKAFLLQAMTDSCLFVFEKEVRQAIRNLCSEKGVGISGRHEAGMDRSFSLQQRICRSVDAKRTLGVTSNENHVLLPEKTMALAYDVGGDPSVFRLEHDCAQCGRQDCGLRSAKLEGQLVTCPAGDVGTWLAQQEIMENFPCGGNGRCGKCRVQVVEGALPVTAADKAFFSKDELQAGWRLACQAVAGEEIRIRVPAEGRQLLRGLGKEGSRPALLDPDHEYGAAVDIGTTTIAVMLADRTNKNVIHTVTTANSQRACGADVISRVQAAVGGQGEDLRRRVRRDICRALRQLWREYPQAKKNFHHLAVAGNTIMIHLLMGWDCSALGTWPFKPVSLGGKQYAWQDVFGEEEKLTDCAVTLLPGVSTYIGADITAGIWKCGLLKSDEAALLVDLGTNGELALAHEGKLAVAATAAGPALEGSSLQWGVASVSGAICGVDFDGVRTRVKTIDHAAPVGICGTGIIECLAGLVERGIVDGQGKLAEPYWERGFPVAETAGRKTIRLSQKDIREIQLAKSAIRAGIETLLHERAVPYDAVGAVYLAGGFGYYLKPEKAAAIGLLPPPLAHKSRAAGNMSLAGAAAVLFDDGVLTEMETICRAAREITLANDPFFHEAYIRYIDFYNSEE